MSKKLYEEMSAGTMADDTTKAEVTSSSQTIAKPVLCLQSNKFIPSFTSIFLKEQAAE